MKSAYWNTVFGLVFAGLVLSGMAYLMERGLLVRSLPLGDFALIALATFRLIRLVSYDVMTAFLREPLRYAPQGTFLGTLSSLLNCPWCTGIWLSALVVFAYFASPLSWFPILILAIAGVASLLQLLSNLVGWHAEGEKHVVEEVEGKTPTRCT